MPFPHLNYGIFPNKHHKIIYSILQAVAETALKELCLMNTETFVFSLIRIMIAVISKHIFFIIFLLPITVAE